MLIEKEGITLQPKKKTTALSQRKREEQLQKQRMKRLIWFSSVAVLLILIIIVFSIKPKPAKADIPYDTLPVLGNKDAKVKVVEFGDYQCPACKDFTEQVKPKLVKDYVDKGQVAFYFMNFSFLGEESNLAALAAQAVYHQSNEAFWKYYEALYHDQGTENSGRITPAYLVELAKKENLQIDYNKLQQDIDSKKYQDEVDRHNAKTDELGVQSTPTVLVNGTQYTGHYLDYDSLKKDIDKALKGE
ncbi:thioredoxin domain-containing protein [Paenibacillus sp. YPG26]|uniref:DsbA family protein n=1 Tax=Paenibacillus sp. YPG26 TaxID=2878915 RepID=UPI00203C96E1|nr:thioredoxin domain-containing protein [Paenibacillus sp. YPG26]USB34340.1 DsbA family protein [Paenibacillus sp. YPG26]